MRFERLVEADRLKALLRTIAVPVMLIGELYIPERNRPNPNSSSLVL